MMRFISDAILICNVQFVFCVICCLLNYWVVDSLRSSTFPIFGSLCLVLLLSWVCWGPRNLTSLFAALQLLLHSNYLYTAVVVSCTALVGPRPLNVSLGIFWIAVFRCIVGLFTLQCLLLHCSLLCIALFTLLPFVQFQVPIQGPRSKFQYKFKDPRSEFEFKFRAPSSNKNSKFQPKIHAPNFNPSSKVQVPIQASNSNPRSKFQYKFQVPVQVPSFNTSCKFDPCSNSSPKSQVQDPIQVPSPSADGPKRRTKELGHQNLAPRADQYIYMYIYEYV